MICNKKTIYEIDIAGGPRRPFVAVLGGAALGDKAGAISALLDKIDALVVGGGVANAFLKARGGRIGRSLLREEDRETAIELLKKASERGVKIFLPIDALAANEISPDIKPSLEGAMALFDDKIAMDIGPRTIKLFRNVILTAGTVIWSGPMGIFEFPAYANGTKEIAQAVAETSADTIVCGGSTVDAAEQFGAVGRLTYLSPCGNTFLRYFAGEKLSGVMDQPDR